MKSQLIAIVAAVLVVGCGPKAPDISIHDAVEKGNIEAVKQHIAAGTDVNANNVGGRTPLYWAAYGGHKETAELLIAEGADVNAKQRNGSTPLDMANDRETADLLRKHGGKSGAKDSIHVAANTGNTEAVKQHLVAGTDVDAKNERGATPLHHAAFHGHKETAELLIAEGADVNTKDKKDFTPLDGAIIRNHTETVDLLRKHGGKTKKELEAAGK
jgi:ankyrin repeat protein